MNTNNSNTATPDLKPSLFTILPIGSVCQKSEAETIATNIMVILKRTGDIFRKLTWEEYKEERLKDGKFSSGEASYFDMVIDYCTDAKSASLFSPAWKDVYDKTISNSTPIATENKNIEWYTTDYVENYVNNNPKESKIVGEILTNSWWSKHPQKGLLVKKYFPELQLSNMWTKEIVHIYFSERPSLTPIEGESKSVGHTVGEWIAGETDTYGEFDIVARPIPADGGDIICCAPQGWEDSMKRWTANKKRIVTCVNNHDALVSALKEILRFGSALDKGAEALLTPDNFIKAIAEANQLLNSIK